MLNLGTLLVAAGVYFFKFPNNFSTGGVSGLAIVLGHYIPGLSSGALVFLINMALLGVGFAVFGKALGCAQGLLQHSVFPGDLGAGAPLSMSAPFTTQPLLELVFAVGLPAVGSALLFNMDASTGGTDVVAMLLKKYTMHQHRQGAALRGSGYYGGGLFCFRHGDRPVLHPGAGAQIPGGGYGY